LKTNRHPSSQRFHDLLTEIGELHDRKQEDYGRGDDPFFNVRSSALQWGVPVWAGALMRAGDKLARLQVYAQRGTLANEGARDSFMDLVVYGLIGLVLWEEEQRAKEEGKATTADGSAWPSRQEHDNAHPPTADHAHERFAPAGTSAFGHAHDAWWDHGQGSDPANHTSTAKLPNI